VEFRELFARGAHRTGSGDLGSRSRGEILAIARSLTSALWKPSARDPEMRGIRYNLFSIVNPIAGHSMIRMAVKLAAAAGHTVLQQAVDQNGR
jgi:hypothetical protein